MDRMDYHMTSISPTGSLKRKFKQFIMDNNEATSDSAGVNILTPPISGLTNNGSIRDVVLSHSKPLTIEEYYKLPLPDPGSHSGTDTFRLHPSIRATYRNRITPHASSPPHPKRYEATKGLDSTPGSIGTNAAWNGAAGTHTVDILNAHARPDHPGWDNQAHAFGVTHFDGAPNPHSTHSGSQQAAWSRDNSHHTHLLASEPVINSFDRPRPSAGRIENSQDLASVKREKTMIEAHTLDKTLTSLPIRTNSPNIRPRSVPSRDRDVKTGDGSRPSIPRRLLIIERLIKERVAISKADSRRDDMIYDSGIEEGYEPDLDSNDDDDEEGSGSGESWN